MAFLTLVPAPAVATETAPARLEPGQSLGVGDSLTSPDGHYTLLMQTDGNLVQYVGSRAVWNTRTYGHPGTVARMQTDGNFVLYAPGLGAIWSTRTYGHPGAYLILRNDASLRVSVTKSADLWTSGVVDSQVSAGQGLRADWFVQSPNEKYRLLMQTDGNFVLYEWEKLRPVWGSATYGNPGSDIRMQTDGNLVIYAPGRGPIWSSRTYGYRGATLQVEDTGRLAMYGPGQVLVWSTAADGDYVIEDRDDLDEVRSVAHQMATDRGWGSEEQLSCIDQLFESESGWRWNADNPYSEAYGIPQATPGSKMASEGDDWRDNPVTQIKWGYTYIEDRYVTPCGAWEFWKVHHWYVVGP